MTKFPPRMVATAFLAVMLPVLSAAPAWAILPLCRPVSTAGFHQASSAMHLYGEQRYAAAFARLRSLATSGNPYAQNQIAIMYNRGLGVARDYETAARWWKHAADRGQATAQCNLGMMYLYGQGVAQDDVKAYAYFNAAAASGSRDARRHRDLLETWRLTPSELKQAQELSRAWASPQ